MKYVNYLADEKGKDSTDEKVLIQMIRDNLVFEKLKAKGYTIFNIESGSRHTHRMENVDYKLCGPNSYATREFNIMLIRTSILNPVHVKLFLGDNREKNLCGFYELEEMPLRNEKPKFVFTHFIIPHAPFIFGENGEVTVPAYLTLDFQYADWDPNLYLGQLKFATKKIKQVVEKLTDSDTPPIIIIQSDHGMRGGGLENDYEWGLSFFNNFKAYYFPDKGRNLEFESTTPVNSFRTLFNLYFDEDYELLEDRMYSNWPKKPYQFEDVTDILIGN